MTLKEEREACREHFRHGADIGIRGCGRTQAQAFEQAALALTAVVTELDKVRARTEITVCCNGTDDEFLFLDWINALILKMATRNMLFCRFRIVLDEPVLSANVWGEAVDAWCSGRSIRCLQGCACDGGGGRSGGSRTHCCPP